MKRSVFITGAARGIGLACSRAFADENWLVYGVDVLQPEDDHLFSHFLKIDLTTDAGLEEVFSFAREMTCLNVLVNNAAIQIIKSLQETTGQDIDQVMSLNFKVPLFLAQEFLPLLRSGGSIVNISSVHALATSKYIGAYAAGKAALLSLTRSMALEFGEMGIRANALLPGAIDTKMLKAGLNRNHKSVGYQQQIQQLASRHASGRIGQPEEIARAVLFLADNSQSGFMTGQSIVIDGGCLARLSTE
ncbi:SDR family NAD(P)-dependent oxidoreductase [Desulfofustis glycolicus]|uniref:NAD(P)-dependent dehydrogenase, short-chain alcohol dehydrogenase family n=1 Tax=Desulfofustis glycolicus DSM 9705 TaxID=1121409 RepID=A0A1M5U0D1_9BACT|nr:SDR family oxidoreductase [Desulfofustis glycolicus]MCB2214745.1 SDR family oxidoreductase [Desulfobulbaceae bacterium]SHH56103.1 NAD(P)-dependent dehydrogenase, short-chain alcohol dehydrogenase family [Desulfofustis glycolicus DSM 9705]